MRQRVGNYQKHLFPLIMETANRTVKPVAQF